MPEQLLPILRELITEAQPRASGKKEGPIRSNVKIAIKNSIEHRWLLNINYEGDAENDPGYRWVEPCVWGNSKYTGNELLRAWQYRGTTVGSSGYSKTHPRGWRTFRLDRIAGTAPLTSHTFDKPRPDYNPDGDKLMSGVKMQVQFPGKNNNPDDDNTPPGNNPKAPLKNRNTVNRLKSAKPNSPTSPTSPGGIAP
jgi:hypothetical protein